LRNVLAVAPCGAGKTINMAAKFHAHNGASVAIAHRQELVSQISLALAQNGLRHRIIGSEGTVRACVRIHMDELGRNFFDPLGRIAVAGVDTLIKRKDANADPWFMQVTLWQTDEAHHLLFANKWGKAISMFPNAIGVGWTATPGRTDGKGLGRKADGVFDYMVMGPTMRDLINQGSLTEYRVFCPRTEDLHLEDVPVSAGGDYSPEALRKAVHQSRIVGDVVKHYLRIAKGKKGVTFAVDIEHAREITQAFRAAGVRAELVTGETPDVARAAVLRRMRNGDLDMLVNVDIFGEGFSLPAIEVVIFARPTLSYILYAQQFGRVLRILEGKQYGIVIDHVGNVLKHGLPDRPRLWTLERRGPRKRGAGDGEIPGRACPECTSYYPAIKRTCPYCGHAPEPLGRSSPEQVDGDLMELDPAVLALMRAELDRVDGLGPGLGGKIGYAINHNHLMRQRAQAPLRDAIRLWGGWREMLGETPAEVQRRFFFTFGTDVLSACVLVPKDAEALLGLIQGQLTANGIVAAPAYQS
jgi:superfamily II DNA or RNA helicase